MSAEPILSIQELVTTVRTGRANTPGEREVPAVCGVSLDVAPGRTLGLVGESGSGKSMTALSILRLLPPAARIAGGRILFDGVDLATASEAELRRVRGRRIAMIFQEPSTALNPVLTIGDQVGEPLRVHRAASRGEARRRAIELLDRVGIPAPAERARAYPHELSGGMKQRAMIAMALACNPTLLIADEPTTALDVTVQAQILELLGTLRRELGMALLLITHDLGVVAESCDDVAVMYAGRIVEQAPASALFAAPRHPYTVGLLRAMPEVGATAHSRLREIPGTVPALGTAGPGCGFVNRCDRAQTDCAATCPALEGAEGHLIRCFHPLSADDAGRAVS